MWIRFIIHLVISFVFCFNLYAASHHPQVFLEQIKGSKNEGEQIVSHFCINCHAKTPLIPLGAPRIGELQDWKTRLKQGINLLLKHTDEGFNAMPARGGCFECTDQQLILAILAMLPDEGKKELSSDIKAHKKIIM